MADEESLRINFCSMILQAKGDVISNFVAWLDLKVAEYKVYGHMILTESDDNNSAAWPFSSATDPTGWPRAKEGNNVQMTNRNFGHHQNSSIGASQAVAPRSYSGLTSINRRGHPAAVVRRGRGSIRARPARPRSVVANLLKNAISRSSKNTSSNISSSSIPSMSSLVSNTQVALPHTTTSMVNNQPMTDTSLAVAPPSTTSAQAQDIAVKSEPEPVVTLDSDSDTEDVKPNVSGESGSEAGMWLSEPASATDMYASSMSGGDSANVSFALSGAAIPSSRLLPHQSMMNTPPQPVQVSRPLHKGIVPRAGPSTMSPLKQLTPQRSPAGRDSVTELLETHTVQTESGLVFLNYDAPEASGFRCHTCGNQFHNTLSLQKHERVCGKVLSCRYCASRFNRKDSHARHEKYCDARPMDVRHVYQCRHCRKVFNRPDNARSHEKKCQHNPALAI